MILILGGTAESAALARLLAERADLPALVSLAGRTQRPVPPPIPYRIGGFGGVAGLMRFLAEKGVAGVIDATHPFAEQMSVHAAVACEAAGVPLLALRRRPWEAVAGDRWTEVADAEDAAAALGHEPRRVFLTVGRLELPHFLAAPQHFYLIRSIDPPDDLPPQARLILGRGPFEERDEDALMEEEAIEVVVSKSSGGSATYGKIAAARKRGLPVVLIRQPEPMDGVATVWTAVEAVRWAEAVLARPSHG
jgi:precorrin-6A/cobalt-precorrin-6A reductase